MTRGLDFGLLSSPLQQLRRIDVQCSSDAFQTLQGEVTFSSFNTTHGDTVHTQDISEGVADVASLYAPNPRTNSPGSLTRPLAIRTMLCRLRLR